MTVQGRALDRPGDTDSPELPRSNAALFDVRGLVVWVTGVGNPIGHAVAGLFESLDALVLGTEAGSDVQGRRYRTAVCDSADPVSVAASIDECNRLGGLDVLVNCTSQRLAEDLFDVTEESWHSCFDGNVKSAFLCSQAAARAMIAKGQGGSIVNIGSIDADLYYATSPIDSVSHGALNAMTRAMALALAPHAVRVNVIAPAILDLSDEDRSAITPLGFINGGTDVAPAAVFLAGRGALHITGTVLPVDGGRMASL